MIYIDLPADLNLEDDEGRNVARLADAVTGEEGPGARARAEHHRRPTVLPRRVSGVTGSTRAGERCPA